MKRLVAIGIVVVAIAAGALLLLRYAGLAEAVVGAAWRARDGGGVGIATYGVVLAVATAAFVPQIALTIPAGFSYGAAVGFAVAYPASVAASMIAFALGRLSPVFPFAVVNYMLSLTSVRWRQYVVGSVIGLAPVVLLYVYLGSVGTDAVALLRGRFGA